MNVGGGAMRVWAAVFAVALVGTALPTPLAAQARPRVIEGRITRPGTAGRDVPLGGEWVVLHRVGSDAAAPLDSVRTGADGRYRFRYLATGDTAAVYFVSTQRGGVAYFTPPTREPSVRGGDADLMVFDTTSAPVPITVRGRHLVVTAPDSATGRTRTVIEVFELSNDSSRTRVPGDIGRPTFEAALPDGVTAVLGGEGDVSPEAIRADRGYVRVYAPIAPGLKQLSYYYDLPASSAAILFPFEGTAPVLEVLVEDPRGTAVGGGLVEVSPVMVEGRPFKRFLAENVSGSHVLSVTAPGSAGATALNVMLIVTGIGATMLLAIGTLMMRRGPLAFGRRRAPDPESLAREIAALDAAFEATPSPSEAARAEHFVKRAELKGRLNDALAKRDGLA